MIIIATPSRDLVHARYTIDLVRLIQASPEAQYGVAFGTYLNSLRTTLVNSFLKSPATHILFIDSDMRFPPRTLRQLLARDKDIIGANYHDRVSGAMTAQVESKGKEGIEEVRQLGFGVILIHRRVFTKLNKPYFGMPYNRELDTFVGEDIYFCKKAWEAGFKIYVDHDLSQDVKHIGSFEFAV